MEEIESPKTLLWKRSEWSSIKLNNKRVPPISKIALVTLNVGNKESNSNNNELREIEAREVVINDGEDNV